MKMEVLSVQNQFQGQFGVLGGSTKVKDWTTPLLTPPPASHQHHHHQQQQNNHFNNNHHNNNINNINNNNNNNYNNNNNIDKPKYNKYHTNNNINNNNSDEITITTSSSIDDATLQALSMRLQTELRAAKIRHLACTEVLLPADLLHRVVSEMIAMSEKEPCGIRGCGVFIEFEDEPGNTRRIASLQIDSNTVSTFELYLTLKHDRSGWTSILPQFLKNLTRSSTIMISQDFTLTKNKLYNSFSD